jgi:Domain of unknown function (DUF4157)
MRWWFFRSKASAPEAKTPEPSSQEAVRPHSAAVRILNLQQAVGNQAVQRMIAESSQEAEGAAQSHPAHTGGELLPQDVRGSMEARFGEDFGDVRVHADDAAATAADALDARAYTVGRDVYFARGMYAPRDPEGQRLIAHELTHVVQQESTTRGGDSRMSLARSQPGDAAEVEADALADQVVSGTSVRPYVSAGRVLALDRDTPKSGSKGPAQEPEENPKPEPETPELTAKLDRIAQQYRDMIKDARDKGYNVAADNLQRFLDGTGGVKKIDVTWLRSFSATTDAEKVNQQRFETSLAKIAKTVEHGMKKEFEDHWDRMYTASPTTELYYASGTSTIRSTGKFHFESIENVVNFGGRVTHHWSDPYDWHEGLSAFIPGHGNISDEDALLLQKYRGAKPFHMEAEWLQDLTGRYTRHDLWFDDVNYSWSGP